MKSIPLPLFLSALAALTALGCEAPSAFLAGVAGDDRVRADELLGDWVLDGYEEGDDGFLRISEGSSGTYRVECLDPDADEEPPILEGALTWIEGRLYADLWGEVHEDLDGLFAMPLHLVALIELRPDEIRLEPIDLSPQEASAAGFELFDGSGASIVVSSRERNREVLGRLQWDARWSEVDDFVYVRRRPTP